MGRRRKGGRGFGSLAEREGLTGKLCFPYMMRGMLRWREGDFDESAKGLRRAAELAEQVGRSEVAFQSLYWLAASLRQRGDYADADTELARALDLCERAGLVAQSVEAISARAVNLALAERWEAAREAADEAERLADRLRYPVGKAASLEARGRGGREPGRGERGLEARLAMPGRRWGGRSTRPAATTCAGACCATTTPTRLVRRSRAPPRAPRAATASTTSPSSPATSPPEPGTGWVGRPPRLS